MKRALACIAALACGCGDNSTTCGEGTNDSDGDGLCEPDVGGVGACGDGTRPDPVTMECVVDPAACGGGTVLVNGRCQDPSVALDIDLEEGPEPNAFEPDAVPAGVIELEPIGGDGFVIHGCIQPTNEAPDFDVYLLDVTQPTLVEITADGVEGLAAGYTVTSTVAALAAWKRFGINLATDMSRRQVLLPAAGSYRLILSDSRTLLPQVSGGSTTPPAGNADGTSCYYVTIDQQMPMPAALDIVNGDTGTIGEALKFYSATGLPSNARATNTITSPHARPSLVVLDGATLRVIDDDGSANFDGSGTPTIVSDFVYNYALSAVPYRLSLP